MSFTATVSATDRTFKQNFKKYTQLIPLR